MTFDWVAKHPEFADAIRRALSPIEDVEQRLQFDYAIYRMQPAEQAGGLDDKVNGMGHTLFREVARDANNCLSVPLQVRIKSASEPLILSSD